jgi:hypothetical protein
MGAEHKHKHEVVYLLRRANMQKQCARCDQQWRSVNQANKERNRNRLLLLGAESRSGIASCGEASASRRKRSNSKVERSSLLAPAAVAGDQAGIKIGLSAIETARNHQKPASNSGKNQWSAKYKQSNSRIS